MEGAREPMEAKKAYEKDYLQKYMIKLWNVILASARQFN